MSPVNFLFNIICIFPNFKNNLKIFTSKKNTNNHWLIFLFNINTQFLFLLKQQINSNLLSLLEITGVDLTKLTNYNFLFNSSNLSFTSAFFNKLIIYNIFDYNISTRFSLFCFLNPKENINSIESIFFNSNWLERELVEFFNINIINRSDTRNLLLDYNLQANPLLKTYPTEGHQEIFFNHLSYNLEYVNTEFIEL